VAIATKVVSVIAMKPWNQVRRRLEGREIRFVVMVVSPLRRF